MGKDLGHPKPRKVTVGGDKSMGGVHSESLDNGTRRSLRMDINPLTVIKGGGKKGGRTAAFLSQANAKIPRK